MKTWLWCLIGVSVGIQNLSAQLDSSNIQIKNLQINTPKDEYLPFSLSNDSILVFTAKWMHETDSRLTEECEQIYYSQKGKKDSVWTTPLSLSLNLNDKNDAALVGVDSTYWYVRKGFGDDGNIFLSKRSAEKLTTSKILHSFFWNSSSDESAIATRKEETYFISNRDGNYDIWSFKNSESSAKVDILNSSSDEQDVWITLGGDTLFFSSTRPGGRGGYDIYMSVWNESSWSTPINLWWLNTSSDDRDLRWYGSKGYFSSTRPGGKGGFDIYEILIPNIIPPQPPVDTVVKRDTIIKQDTLVPPIVIKTLDSLGFSPKNGMEIQLFASFELWETFEIVHKFACLKEQALKIITQTIEGYPPLHKCVIDSIYFSIDNAILKQEELLTLGCLPNKDLADRPFIAVYNQDHTQRIALFWYREEYTEKRMFEIRQSGKTIWKMKRF